MVNLEITDGSRTINYKISVSCTASEIKKIVEKEIGSKDFTLLLDGQTLGDTEEISINDGGEEEEEKKISLKIVYSGDGTLLVESENVLSNKILVKEKIDDPYKLDLFVKPKCHFDCCSIKVKIKTECKFCEKIFCGKHRIPEEHKCGKLKDWKNEAKTKNAIKLIKEQSNRNKI